MVFILAPGHSALRDASTSSRRPRDGLGSGTTADRRLLQSASLPSLPTSPHLQREAVIGSTVARRQASEAAFLSGAPRPHTVHAARKGASTDAMHSLRFCRCTNQDHHRTHVFISQPGDDELFCIFCAEGGGGGLDAAARKKLRDTQQKSLEDLTRKLLSGGASPPHIRPSPLSRRRVR